LIAEDASAARLFDQFREQSELLKSLPRFELDSGFADRVLNRVECIQAHDQLMDRVRDQGHVFRSASLNRTDGSIVKKSTGSPPAAIQWRGSAAAIGSLAALILITLFIASFPPGEVNWIALRSRSEAKPPNSLPNLTEPESDVVSHDLADVNPRKSGPAGTTDEAIADLKKGEAVPAAPEPQQEVPPSHFAIRDSRSTPDSQMERELKFEPDHVSKQEDGGLRGGGFGGGGHDLSAEESKEIRDGNKALRDSFDRAAVIGPNQQWVQADVDVLEINFQGGPEKLGELRQSLADNQIEPPAELFSFASGLDENGVQDAPMGNLGYHYGANVNPNTEAFLIVCTPDQMRGLVAQVSQQAVVTGYGFSPEDRSDMQKKASLAFTVEELQKAGLPPDYKAPESDFQPDAQSKPAESVDSDAALDSRRQEAVESIIERSRSRAGQSVQLPAPSPADNVMNNEIDKPPRNLVQRMSRKAVFGVPEPAGGQAGAMRSLAEQALAEQAPVEQAPADQALAKQAADKLQVQSRSKLDDLAADPSVNSPNVGERLDSRSDTGLGQGRRVPESGLESQSDTEFFGGRASEGRSVRQYLLLVRTLPVEGVTDPATKGELGGANGDSLQPAKKDPD
jgi:hypothetical protein